jgi:hypothetical protein
MDDFTFFVPVSRCFCLCDLQEMNYFLPKSWQLQVMEEKTLGRPASVMYPLPRHLLMVIQSNQLWYILRRIHHKAAT